MSFTLGATRDPRLDLLRFASAMLVVCVRVGHCAVSARAMSRPPYLRAVVPA